MNLLQSKPQQTLMVILSAILLLISLSSSSIASTNHSFDHVEFDPYNEVRRFALDNNGNLIMVGYTSKEDIAITKIDPNGTIIWEDTFGGSDLETVNDFIIDENDNIILTGLTKSNNFPVSDNAFQKLYGGDYDLYLRILKSDGKLILSSYFGGSGSEFSEAWVNHIKLTRENDIIFFGQTTSIDFPVSDNAFQATSPNSNTLTTTLFISKIGFDGTISWSSYFGSTGRDWGQFDLDSDDNIIIAGSTGGPGLPGADIQNSYYHGVRDAFVSKISKQGEIIFTRYLGGSGQESGWEFKIDSENNIILIGQTSSDDLDVSANAIQKERKSIGNNPDLFIYKLNPEGEIIWSTYYGGSGNDVIGSTLDKEDDNSWKIGPRLMLDSNDNILFTTRTSSTDLPTPNAFSENIIGVSSYLAKLSPDGLLVFGTYLPGWVIDLEISLSNEIIMFGNDLYGHLQTTPNAFQKDKPGFLDSYYIKLLPNGTVSWSSYLGGNDLDETVKGVSLNEDGFIIVGMTISNDLPLATNEFGGNNDIFICKISLMGDVEYCSYIGGEGDDRINRAGIIFDEEGNIIVMGITSSQDLSLTNPSPSDYDQTALIKKIKSDGEEIWTNVLLPEARSIDNGEEDKNDNVKYIIIGTIISSVIVLLYYFKSVLLKSGDLDNHLLNTKMNNILSPIFNSKPQLIHIFGATKIFKENEVGDEIHSELPRAILDFKYFLHPVRLSIIKLLDENINLTTVNIKDLLGISWNEVLFHLNSLKKTEYITINQQFIDGTTKTIVSAETRVIAQYNALKDILFEFLDGTPNLEKYLDHATQVKMRSEDPDLYPNNHQ